MEQIESLHIILAEMLPTQDDSRLKRGKKEILSLRQDSKVESITKILHGYIGTLTFYYTATLSALQPMTGTISKLIKKEILLGGLHPIEFSESKIVIIATLTRFERGASCTQSRNHTLSGLVKMYKELNVVLTLDHEATKVIFDENVTNLIYIN
jgi:hypothetical protein